MGHSMSCHHKLHSEIHQQQRAEQETKTPPLPTQPTVVTHPHPPPHTHVPVSQPLYSSYTAGHQYNQASMVDVYQQSKPSQQCELIYFESKGRGELARMLFVVAGERFTDTRLKIDTPSFKDNRCVTYDDWHAIKDNEDLVPFGTVPVLVIRPDTEEKSAEPSCNELRIPQSGAINRYLAKKFKLMGSDEVESALIDAVYEEQKDWRDATGWGVLKPKEEIMQWINEVYPTKVIKLDHFIRHHGGETAAIGDHLSLADIALFQWLDYWTSKGMDKSFLPLVQEITRENAACVWSVIKRVQDLSPIEEYLALRGTKGSNMEQSPM